VLRSKAVLNWFVLQHAGLPRSTHGFLRIHAWQLLRGTLCAAITDKILCCSLTLLRDMPPPPPHTHQATKPTFRLHIYVQLGSKRTSTGPGDGSTASEVRVCVCVQQAGRQAI
jgi:hypothetical protein